ncbi:MAG TPA: 16S rRNA (adenine(1518)-N(6)/adenine(1519)-N(6))-dimethyltransferase RsmA, partial [Tepidisphaeraceae bacterium]
MARQKLGQHFLVSEKALDRIAAAACGSGVPLVVEIGPGKGALTAKLLPLAGKLVALEIDPGLVAYQRARFGDQPNFEIHQQDAVQAEFSAWPGAVIVGNLPYYVATPIIERVVRAGVPRAVFLIQREVAERITALPGSRAYGFLSTLLQFMAETRLLFRVAPGCFHPPPKVDSAVIELRPRE